MKVNTIPTPKPAKRKLVSIITFDPWPFAARLVDTTLDWIDELDEVKSSGAVWSLDALVDNTIVTFDDGKSYVTSADGLELYFGRHPEERA